MPSIEIQSPMRQTHAEALRSAQTTQEHLQQYARSGTLLPIPLLSNVESVESWSTYQNLMLSCLGTGDDRSAFLCLERLIERFGNTNERTMGLQGIYQEAVALNENALEVVLHGYNEALAEDPVNTVWLPTCWASGAHKIIIHIHSR